MNHPGNFSQSSHVHFSSPSTSSSTATNGGGTTTGGGGTTGTLGLGDATTSGDLGDIFGGGGGNHQQNHFLDPALTAIPKMALINPEQQQMDDIDSFRILDAAETLVNLQSVQQQQRQQQQQQHMLGGGGGQVILLASPSSSAGGPQQPQQTIRLTPLGSPVLQLATAGPSVSTSASTARYENPPPQLELRNSDVVGQRTFPSSSAVPGGAPFDLSLQSPSSSASSSTAGMMKPPPPPPTTASKRGRGGGRGRGGTGGGGGGGGRGRGRGRGRGSSTASGGGAASASGNTVPKPGEHLATAVSPGPSNPAAADDSSEDGAGSVAAATPVSEDAAKNDTFAVGDLAVRNSLFDDLLNRRKLDLLGDPEIQALIRTGARTNQSGKGGGGKSSARRK